MYVDETVSDTLEELDTVVVVLATKLLLLIILDTNILLAVTLPVALIAPPVNKLPPVILLVALNVVE